jgi:hypothetical protein
MDKRKRSVLAAGSLLVAAAAIAQSAHSEYSANVAVASRTLSPAARRAMQDRIEAVNAKFRASHEGRDPEQFGLQCCQITQIPSASFVSLSGGEGWLYTTQGYISAGANSAGLLFAPVVLPTGVEVEYLDLYYYDGDAANDIKADLFAFSGGGPLSGVPGNSLVATAQSSGNPGYGYAASGLVAYAVNNNVGYDPNAAQLMVRLEPDLAHDIALGFKAVDLWWMRLISPPPATATFSDVPTGHPFFQFVEALAAAGITVGYPDGRFGVDDPITRGQMAVFLAKALGLYWSY